MTLQSLQSDFAELVAYVNGGGEEIPESPPGQEFEAGDDPPDPGVDGPGGEVDYGDGIPEEGS